MPFQSLASESPDRPHQVAPLPPLLKWPGGKRALLKDLVPLLPVTYGNYYEPFVGGGALFFRLRPNAGLLSDINADLIDCYRQIRDNPDSVIGVLNRLPNNEESYYRIRSWVPSSATEAAARLIYLTSLSFNGIHRLNLSGHFNVPYGHKTHLKPCDPVKIHEISRALEPMRLDCCDFESAIQGAEKGDLIYLDPPYTVAHGNNGFLKYNSRIFSWEDQIRLAATAKELASRGCWTIISNAYHPSITQLYEGFEMRVIERYSVMAAAREYRRKIRECVFFNEV